MLDLVACGAGREQRVTGGGVDGYRGQGDRADGEKRFRVFIFIFLSFWPALHCAAECLYPSLPRHTKNPAKKMQARPGRLIRRSRLEKETTGRMLAV